MKLAFVGVENSHAPAFLQLIQKNPEKYGDIEVVGVYSYDGAAADKLVADGLAPRAVRTAGAFLTGADGVDAADCVVNTARHGDNHYEYSLPYLRAGIPMFIDKPFAMTTERAREMVEAAKAGGANLCGGSCLKFAPELAALKRSIEAGELGSVLSATFSAPVNMSNPYGGFFFYAQHLLQMMTAVFGNHAQSVYARARDNAVTAIVTYPHIDITLHYVGYCYSASIYGDKASRHVQIGDVSALYGPEFDELHTMLRTGIMPETYDDLLYPVSVLEALYLSYKTGREIAVL